MRICSPRKRDPRDCLQCGIHFAPTYPFHDYYAKGFCSRNCINDHYCLHPELAAFFWQNVDSSAGIDKCWPWKGRTTKKYGRIDFKGAAWPASRLAYIIANGRIVGGNKMYVCHSCDNPPCVNPAHLWLGTAKDNVRDMVAKGRHVPGMRSRAVAA
jgi:hypothetical protein